MSSINEINIMKTALATFRDGKNNRGPLAEMYIPTSKNELFYKSFRTLTTSFNKQKTIQKL